MKIKIIIASLVAGSFITLLFLLSQCNNKNLELTAEKKELETEKSNLLLSIKKQNEEIEKIVIDYESRLRDYENAKPRTIYVPADVNMTRGNCKDVKNLISGIRNISF